MSATHSKRPWAVSKIFVWVLTWWTVGLGEAAGLVEVLVGRDSGCIFEDGEEQSHRVYERATTRYVM